MSADWEPRIPGHQVNKSSIKYCGGVLKDDNDIFPGILKPTHSFSNNVTFCFSLLCLKSTIIAVFIIKNGSNGRHLYSKLNNSSVQRRSAKYCQRWRAAVYHGARLHSAARYTHCFYSAERGAGGEGGQLGGGVQCRLRRQPPTPPASSALLPCRTGQTFIQTTIFVINLNPLRRRQ